MRIRQQTKIKNNLILFVILACLSTVLLSYAVPLYNNAKELRKIRNILDMIHQNKMRKDEIYNDAYRKGYASALTKLETKGEEYNHEL